MNEQAVRSIVASMLSSYTNMVVPQHTHNGVDSLRIQSKNLISYPIQTGTNISTILTGKTDAAAGTIQFYDLEDTLLRDWGMDISLGGIWNPFTIVPSGTAANLSVAQVFPDTTQTILKANNVFYNLYPTGEYTPSDGTFTCTTAGQYLVLGGVTFDNSGGASGSAIITIFLEHMATPIPFMQKTQSFATTDTSFSLDISGIIQVQAEDLLYVTIEQLSGGSLTTLTDENTWFNVQKMK